MAGLGLLAAALSGAAPGPEDDLGAVRARGTLRVLLPHQQGEAYLPRRGRPIEAERAHAASLARELGVGIEWVYVDTFDDLIPALLDGRGDLIVDNLTATASRKTRVAFSAPVAVVREQIVCRADDVPLERAADLVGRRVVVRRSSSHWERMQALRLQHPGIELIAAPEDMSIGEILERVENGEFDLTLADSNLVRPVLDYRDGLRVAFDLEGVAVIAWAMRPEAVELRAAVDSFLTRVSVTPGRSNRFTGDLDGMKQRGVLRLITRNNAANYYIWNGQLMGFEYELVRELAKRLDLELEIVVPPSNEDLLPWLREGRGDLVAASLPASPERAERERIAFSRTTHRVSAVVVSRADEPPIASPADLAGRTFAVRRGGHAWKTLAALRESGIALELETAPAYLEAEEIIGRVADGRADLTLADSHIVDIELTWREDIRAALVLGEPFDHGWAVRRDNPRLLEVVNAFFDREYRGTFYNVVANRYFRAPKRMRRHAEMRPARAGRISPYDDVVRKYADAYGFDWRLIAAIMQQESRFDPKAVSFAGARGLLQVMPRTAAEFGVGDLEDPEHGILAGVRYLAWLRTRFDETLPTTERNWFTLAAYNAGQGHVIDARALARKHGLDPNRWFGNVERAMLLKRRRDVAAATRFGYCRCDEPVRYVRAVRDRYRAYVEVAASTREPG
jgi:membrane-bound lytic murein transglycosylase F